MFLLGFSREGKGGALLGLAFFSLPQKAGAGDRPARGTPKKVFLNFFVWANFLKNGVDYLIKSKGYVCFCVKCIGIEMLVANIIHAQIGGRFFEGDIKIEIDFVVMRI